ncbi:MAG TPA: phage holin family protein [Erythrobacter sp.]|nr:phage holin family protein [Erythrobacter sp.]
MRDDDLPQPQDVPAEDEISAALRGEEPGEQESSIKEDILALVEDSKTYAEAELNYQKSRVSFAANRGKSVALYLLFALGFVHLALIALVIGALLALAPSIGALSATAIVVGALLIGTVILLLMARSKANDVAEAFQEDEA